MRNAGLGGEKDSPRVTRKKGQPERGDTEKGRRTEIEEHGREHRQMIAGEHGNYKA